MQFVLQQNQTPGRSVFLIHLSLLQPGKGNLAEVRHRLRTAREGDYICNTYIEASDLWM